MRGGALAAQALVASPCELGEGTAFAIVSWMSLVQMAGWLLLLPAALVTAFLFARHGVHWAVMVAVFVVSIGLLGSGFTVRGLVARHAIVSRRLVWLIVGFSVGCSSPFTPCQGRPSRLIGGLVSHSSVAAVQKQLKAENWSVVWKSALTPGDQRPPFSDLTVRVDAFEDLGAKGSLDLLFINNRLYRVVFTPSDADRYFRDLERAPGVVRNSPSALQIQPSTRLLLVTEGEIRVIAEDECIASEVDRWIVRYASRQPRARCVA